MMVGYSKSVYTVKLMYLVFSICLSVLTGILAQAVFYVGPIPYTMQNIGIILSGLLLPPRYALFSQLFYLLLIALGLPLGAGFRGGLHVILGYTGGYLVGFPISATLMSILCRRYLAKKRLDLGGIGLREYIVILLFSAIAIVPTYVLGFLVFTHYALRNERLLMWAIGVAQGVDLFSNSNVLAILLVASIAVFVPQDIFIDHVIAIGVAKMLIQFLKNRGIEIE
ncbi:MAG: biotin transporter BioY [Ignisphaera sp.]